MTRLNTSKIAKMAGCHPNTVRLYEELGYLPPVLRSKNGYRMFAQEHLDQMILARNALNGDFAGKPIRNSAKMLIFTAASGDLEAAIQHAYKHLQLVRSEIEQANLAIEFVEDWANGNRHFSKEIFLQTTETSRLLNVTVDCLRTWERNGLINVPRNSANKYRFYGPYEISRLRVIRMLRTAGYSIMAILRMLRRLDNGQTRGLAKIVDTPEANEDFFTAADQWITTLSKQGEKALLLIRLLEERNKHLIANSDI